MIAILMQKSRITIIDDIDADLAEYQWTSHKGGRGEHRLIANIEDMIWAAIVHR